MNTHLIQKYNVPGPRYTSYPTVPYWDETPPTESTWLANVRATYEATRHQGISLYIHLPYCERLCTYCGCTTRITVNHAVETPYIDAVLTEWQLYLDALGEAPLIKEIHLGGGTPTFFSAAHLQRLVRGLTRGARLSPDADLSFEAHPANTTDAHLQALYDVGFRRLSLGIQDFDPNVQRIINRRQSFAEVQAVTESARNLGYNSINFDLIYGLPLQNAHTMAQTLAYTAALQPDRIAFYSYAHVPWLKPAQRSFEAFLPSGEAKRALYEQGKQSLEARGYREIGMDHFALPTDALHRSAQAGTLHRNFMGYTPHQTQLLIGLGASAIGDAWTAFAQNPKAVEPYLESLRAGRLPLQKGHVLTDEDLVLRQHILALMCRLETRWNPLLPENEVLNQAQERLQELEDDRLIEQGPGYVRVLPEGQPFVRNVCMAFDARLWNRRAASPLFSQTV